MSLFPAYSSEKNDEKSADSQDKNWLDNSSYAHVVSNIAQYSTTNQKTESKRKSPDRYSNIKSKDRHKKSKKSKKAKKRKRESSHSPPPSPSLEHLQDNCDLYLIDKTRRLHYLSYKTLTKPVKPRYKAHFECILGYFDNKQTQKKISRYFKQPKKDKDVETTAEEELSVTKKAEEFNKRLCNTSEVSDWISFVDFQDEFYRSQHISYSSEGERKKAILQKKFDILEKALSYNPQDKYLLKLWLKIGNEILSPDNLLTQIQKMLEESPANMTMWLSLISVRQQSLALSTFSTVTELYRKAINTMKNLKNIEISERDSNVLGLLYHYCKFLDQCGHWEILWTILKKNLHLNLGVEFSGEVNVEDEKVKILEDKIISDDKQPIWVTWRKVETLREGVHFLPVSGVTDDPQRSVSTDDIIDFVIFFHRDIHFRLIVLVITLLKVPLLPLNNAIFNMLHKDRLNWSLDSPEFILSTIIHSPAVDIKVNFLRHAAQVTRGPQYLRNEEGQQEFLELVQKTFQTCMKLLTGLQKMFLGLWWLRFNRWLYLLDKNSLASLKVPAKKMKHIFKDFMKNEENRDNLIFYCEYSLFEYSQGNIEASIKTLKTLILSRPSVYHLSNKSEKGALCHVFKCLCEIYLATGQTQNAVALLINLGRGAAIDTQVTADSVDVALRKFANVATGLIKEMSETSATLEEFFLPQFSLEWIACYMWLLALTKSTAQVRTYIEDVCLELKDCENLCSDHAREYLWETTSVIFYVLEKNNIYSVSHIIKDTLCNFPYNLKVLSLLAAVKLEDHGLWWTFKQSFLNPPTIFGCIMLVCVALERKGGDVESFANRIKSLFQQLILTDGKLCSVIHNLRLKFLFEFDNEKVDVAHVNALESCPWNKGVYMGAVSVLPNKLMELTDVMIEKELRIHVTPDEIQEMRD